MLNWYARWMDRWENRLASRDTNRVLRPFEWGLEWLGIDGHASHPAEALAGAASNWIAGSQSFYSYSPVVDYSLTEGHLTFSSPLATPYPENNLVHARLFRAKRDRARAVVVLPQWNAGEDGHEGLCKLLNRFGITALRMSLAYHGRRMPAELSRADYHVSSNIGRTIHACRQSVVDARACLDWLKKEGYARLGILGTSLGSCIAFITAAHDSRLKAAVYNHASTYFGDVIWTGLSTRHVRQGIDGALTQAELRKHWEIISPASFLDLMARRDIRSLIVWGRYDTSFLPSLTREMIAGFRTRGIPLETRVLPCGHYTTGELPFNLLDGFTMCRFLQRHL